MLNEISVGCIAYALTCAWIPTQAKNWWIAGTASVLLGFVGGSITFLGLATLTIWALLWVGSLQVQARKLQELVFWMIVVAGLLLYLPYDFGIEPIGISSKFRVGLLHPIVGLLPLALLVPLATTWQAWKEVFFKATPIILLGFAFFAGAALLSGVVQWNPKMPTFLEWRIPYQFFLVAIPEEAFFRGFLQHQLFARWEGISGGRWIALCVTSLLFTLVHLTWAPSWILLAFVFTAGIFYGIVYWFSRRIEAAIVAHFLFNMIHMIFFSYHAM